MTQEQSHFTAVIKVEKIIHQSDNSGRTPSVKRLKGEITHVTVRASSIERLKQKLASHIDLIDDDAFSTPEEGTFRN